MTAKGHTSVSLQSVGGGENDVKKKLTKTNARGETDVNTMGLKLTETTARGETDVKMMSGIKLTETNARGEDMNMIGLKLTETNAHGVTDVKMMWGIKLTETNASDETDVKTSDAFLTVLRSPAVKRIVPHSSCGPIYSD
jgi:hypothetical protein